MMLWRDRQREPVHPTPRVSVKKVQIRGIGAEQLEEAELKYSAASDAAFEVIKNVRRAHKVPVSGNLSRGSLLDKENGKDSFAAL